jgi:putative DNA primase/helicase
MCHKYTSLLENYPIYQNRKRLVTTQKYNILEHLGALTRSGESKTKYYCPVCQKNDFDVNPNTGKYGCFSGGCDPKDIRAAIDELEGKPKWQPEINNWVKPKRSKSRKEFIYLDRDGNPLVKVVRTDDGNGTRKFSQYHWDGSKWGSGNPDPLKTLIPIYRYAEVRKAIERNEYIFVVEGEGIADLLWDLGIAATTTIGGSNGYRTYGNYAEDLAGAKLILSPDRDDIGCKYMANFAKDFSSQIECYYLAGAKGLWLKPEGAMDIGDDIRDHQLTKEQILAKVVSPEEYQQIRSAKTVKNNMTEGGKQPPYFTSTIESGLGLVSFQKDKDGEISESFDFVGNHLVAIACIDNPDRDGAALLLEFKTSKGDIRRWTMLRAYLAGDGSAIVEGLLSRGYSFKRKQKSSLLDYIQTLGEDVEKNYTVTDLSGWYRKNFVTPHKTYGDENLKFRDVELSPEAITEIMGTLESWLDRVASKCAENSRAIFVLGNSFAAPLLRLLGIESGGFHLYGPTSKGKTTLLSLAASVTGFKKIAPWRATSNGIEGIAAECNHLCLLLDEIAQADSRDVGNIIYMIGNGKGKIRMNRDGTIRKTKEWLLMILSSGEVEIASYMKQANIIQKGGQEVRLIDIPAIPEGAKYGCFETIHGADNAVQFVSKLDAAVKEHHGTALDAFLSLLVIDAADATFVGNLSKQVYLFATKLAEGTVDSAVGRVAKRFALVQVALELAHKYALLPFPIKQIDWAISTIFQDWLNARGGDGSIEIKRAIARIEHLLVTNEISDRVHDLRNGSDQIVRNLLAYRKVDSNGDTEEFWVPPSVFEQEFCNGVNKTELVNELQRIGWLIEPRKDGKSIHQRKINKKPNYYYVFGKRENDGEAGELGEA